MIPPGVRPDGEGAWYLEQWRHDRDQARIQREFWPFRWGVPAAQWGPDAPRHPLDSPGPALPPAVIARRRRAALLLGRHQLPDRYAEQAALYTQAAGRVYRPGRSGAAPDLVIFDEIASQEPGYTGTALHQLMETFGRYFREWSG